MAYDPTSYLGSAAHYLRGRPPYSESLPDVLARELHLDGTGRLLDVGCGPGVLAVQLAGLFDRVTGLDPYAAMLDEARRHAAEQGVTNTEWMAGRSARIGLPPLGSRSNGPSARRWPNQSMTSWNRMVPL